MPTIGKWFTFLMGGLVIIGLMAVGATEVAVKLRLGQAVRPFWPSVQTEFDRSGR